MRWVRVAEGVAEEKEQEVVSWVIGKDRDGQKRVSRDFRRTRGVGGSKFREILGEQER
jgi:hypothetical protein